MLTFTAMIAATETTQLAPAHLEVVVPNGVNQVQDLGVLCRDTGGGADGTVRLFRGEQVLMMKDLAYVRLAETGPDISAAQTLLWNYAATLPPNQCLSDLKDLPGPYRAPSGALLVAWQSGIASGCVAIRPLEGAGRCELKRLYVEPAARRAGLGRMLVQAASDHASRLGYVELVLDTMPSMLAAVALYQQLGFAPAAPYYLSSSPDMLFFSTKLQK